MASVTVPETRDAPAGLAKKRNYGRILEQAWISWIVGYSILRFVIAWGAFSDHGANVWVFGLIDIGTAWPYAKSVAVVCKRAAERNWARLPSPLALALGTFFAPYAYLWFAAGEMPDGVRAGMAVCVSVLLVAATAGVLSKTRKLRREDDVSEPTTDDTVVVAGVGIGGTGDVIDLRANDKNVELLIDLTGDEVRLERSIVQS